MTEASRYGLHIFPQHAALLEASAISPEVTRARGYTSVDTAATIRKLKFAKAAQVPGLLIPIHGTDGELRLHQYRPDVPRLDSGGKECKYETPWRARICLDVPPQARGKLTDPDVPLWITEGARKADAAVSAGLCCIALIGVDGWMSRGVALPDWGDVLLRARDVYVAFDSDVMVKPAVSGALGRLTKWLTYREANVRHVILPAGEDGAKTGLDDFLAGHPADDLLDLALSMPAPSTPAKHAHTRTPTSDQSEQVCKPDKVCMHTPLLAGNANLLAEAVATVHKLGVTGEERIIRGTFLTAVSQVLAEPVSLVVKGTSAGGKSYSTRTTLRLFPETDFYKVTAGSQRSLIFTDVEFSHKTIVMFEATALREVAEARDGDMTAMIVRTLLSEGQIIYDVTERGSDGQLGTRRITKRGPTNLIVTTTASNLHQENETRLLSLTVDESEEQTRAVMVRTAARRSQAIPADPVDLDSWHDLFHWLKHHAGHRVLIPYADYLANNAAAAVVRMRRDFGVLLGMIEAHAVLHQVSRKRDAHGRIIATTADYHAARNVLAEAFAVSSGKKVKDSVRNAVAAVDALRGNRQDPSDVTVAQVATHLRRDRTVATRSLKEAADLGYLTNREDKPGRPAKYRLGPDVLPAEDQAALPDDVPEPEDPPDEACTPAQVAHLTPQVSEGCAGVQVCAGGAATACTECGEPLDPSLIAAGYTDHGETPRNPPPGRTQHA